MMARIATSRGPNTSSCERFGSVVVVIDAELTRRGEVELEIAIRAIRSSSGLSGIDDDVVGREE